MSTDTNIGFLITDNAFFINSSNQSNMYNGLFIENSNIIIGDNTAVNNLGSIINLYGTLYLNDVPLSNMGGGGGGGGGGGSSDLNSGCNCILGNITSKAITTQNYKINAGSGTITAATFSGNATSATTASTASTANNASNLIGSPNITVRTITTQNNTINLGSGTITAACRGWRRCPALSREPEAGPRIGQEAEAQGIRGDGAGTAGAS